ncbi:threonine synthase [Streptococcus pneumoniae SP23-BS72]|nr:threonine synthase [Streptococcus pneumoniae SP3-BS71]EDK80747.1 threonine synthase [Streptococcus pneumoniae SP23-BS72]
MGSIPTARVNRIMAGVVKWLTHQIVALACVGSIPITRLFYIIGV